MDTELELAMDKWIFDHIGCCGTCIHKRYGCQCETSPFYGEAVEDNGGCDEYMEKRVYPKPCWKGGKK